MFRDLSKKVGCFLLYGPQYASFHRKDSDIVARGLLPEIYMHAGEDHVQKEIISVLQSSFIYTPNIHG